MSMVFCRGCGKEIHETALTCPHCGAPQALGGGNNNQSEIPNGIKGWSWGAFLLNGIWAIGNKTWIGLLAFVPVFGFVMAIMLGFKGREWAWKNKQWESLEHFNRVQKKWSFWAVVTIIIVFLLGVLITIAMSAYDGYIERAKSMQSNQSQEITYNTNTSSTESMESSKMAVTSSSTLDRIFSPEMFDVDIAYFEKIAGAAINTTANVREYKIDGCDVTANIGGDKINSLKLNVNQNCTFNLNAFVNRGFSSVNTLTFGQFNELSTSSGQFIADCLMSCGNSSDSIVSEYWIGSNAEQSLEIKLDVELVDTAAIDAAHNWKEAMSSKGEDWIIEAKFNCDGAEYDSVAHEAFKNVKITAITIGYYIEKPSC